MSGKEEVNSAVSPPLGGSLTDLKFWDKKKAVGVGEEDPVGGPGWDQEDFARGCQITLSKSEENLFQVFLKLLGGRRR